ncbi:MAG TPA: type II toxin-antitoxin system RelE/ParE family toxin [Gammaproteobacteria bacterium]|nr:type II toxin-antitoxin system RelE/ParE family toxin [Gammaproteobacteria bacterium]
MVWTIKVSEIAEKQIKKLDKAVAKRIVKYLKERVISQKNPRSLGKALLHDKTGLWRYRVDDYRIICQIKDHELTILVLQLGHRKNIYD